MYPSNRKVLINDKEFLINLRKFDINLIIPGSWGYAQKTILLDAEEYSDYLFLFPNGKYSIRKYKSEEEHPRYHLKFAEFNLELGEYLILDQYTKDIKHIKEYAIKNYPLIIHSEQSSDIIFINEESDLDMVIQFRGEIFEIFYYAVSDYSIDNGKVFLFIRILERDEIEEIENLSFLD